MAGSKAREIQEHAQRVETLLDAFRDADDREASDRAEELVRAVVALHTVGLRQLLTILDDVEPGGGHPDGRELVRRLAEDDVVANLLLLHDLHPDNTDTRIERALDRVRPYLGSHAGGIHYDGVTADQVAHLRLEGSCDGCPSSSLTVRSAVEQAVLEAAPEVVSIDVQGMVAEPPLLQIGPRPGADAASPSIDEHTLTLEGLAEGVLRQHDVDGSLLCVCIVGGTPYAYLDRCAGCGTALSMGSLSHGVVTCVRCRERYDLRAAGRALSHEDEHLTPVPLLPEGSGWKVLLQRGVPV